MRLPKPYRLKQDKLNGTVHIVKTDHTGQPKALCSAYYPTGADVPPADMRFDDPAFCEPCNAHYCAATTDSNSASTVGEAILNALTALQSLGYVSGDVHDDLAKAYARLEDTSGAECYNAGADATTALTVRLENRIEGVTGL